MDKKTRRALEASIRHWERMASGKRRKMKLDGKLVLEEPQSEFCALCRINDIDCTDCIISNDGYHDCDGSPYYEARGSFGRYGADSQQFKQAAQTEVEFLKEIKQKYFD